MIELRLPWPPSANTYWRHPNKGPLAGRTLISQEGRAYRATVIALVLEKLRRPPRLSGRLAVDVEAFMPDLRRRDLMNLEKATSDALTHAGLWLDDEQIDDFRIRRGPVLKPGCLVLQVREIAPAVAQAELITPREDLMGAF